MSIFHGSYEQRVTARVETAGAFIKQVGQPLVRRWMGDPLNQEGINRRILEGPQHDAEQGAAAVHDALESEDPELRRFGAAMVVKAVVKANEVHHGILVPPEVTQAVTDIAKSLPPEDITDNPCISAPEAGMALDILEHRVDPAGPDLELY